MKLVYFPSLILGSGVGGLTGAIYLDEASIPFLVFAGNRIGGALMQSDSVRNWPGSPNLPGKDIISKIISQIKQRGIDLFYTSVINVDLEMYKPLIRIQTQDFHPVYKTNLFLTRTLIVATGSSPRKLNIPGENKWFGKGVYTCAICEGSRVKEKVVGVVGGGDSAIAKSLYLLPLVKKLYLFVRKSDFSVKDVKRVNELHGFINQGKLVIYFETILVSINGKDEIQSVNLISRGKKQILPLEAIFLSIGILPNTQLFPTLTKRKDGTLKTFDYQETSDQRIFAAGDCTDNKFRQAITAAGEGSKCALQIKSFLDLHVPFMPHLSKKSLLTGFRLQPLEINFNLHKIHISPLLVAQGAKGACGTECHNRDILSSHPTSSTPNMTSSLLESELKHSTLPSPASAQAIQIQTYHELQAILDQFPLVILEITSSKCPVCMGFEFVLQDLRHKFNHMKFVQIDLEKIPPEEMKQIGNKLSISDKIDLPYMAKIYHGKKFRSIQGENQILPKNLNSFLRT